MISFDDVDNIDMLIKNKISLPIVSSTECKKVISCKPVRGMTNNYEIQNE